MPTGTASTDQSGHDTAPHATHLQLLDFTELLISTDPPQAQLRRPEKGHGALRPIPPTFESSVAQLAHSIEDHFGAPDTGDAPSQGHDAASPDIRVLIHDGIRLKIRRAETPTGPLYLCRRIHRPPPFSQLTGIPDQARAHMLSLGRTHETGLLLFAGLPGSGKTTTLISYLHRMISMWGDLAIVADRQQEFRVNGIIEGSTGRIVQIPLEISRPKLLHTDLTTTILGFAPRFAVISEITSGADARLALDLALAGILTFATIDAPDVVSAISNITNKASETMTTETARDAVALSLRGCLHQALSTPIDPANPTYRTLISNTLFMPSGPTGRGVATRIRNDQIAQLTTEIEQQANRMAHKQPPIETLQPPR